MDTDDQSVMEQSVYAVMSMDHFMLLRSENDYSISVMQQLESTGCIVAQQVIIKIVARF